MSIGVIGSGVQGVGVMSDDAGGWLRGSPGVDCSEAYAGCGTPANGESVAVAV